MAADTQQRPDGWSAEDADAVLAAAREAWPDLHVPHAFVDRVSELLPAGVLPARATETLRIGDLCIAYLCGNGDEQAVAAFEQHFDAAIATSVRRVNSSRHTVDDLAQIVRQRLFVGEKAAVNAYGGRGSLAAWVGVVAMRTALNAVRGKARDEVSVESPDALTRLGEIEDPQLDFLRHKYRVDFRAAFSRAAEQLTPRERTILRQHLVEKLTVRELGRIYSVNSGTVSRWITAARANLAEQTNAELQADLDVTPEELESIMGLIRSGVELSITRVFGEAAPDA